MGRQRLAHFYHVWVDGDWQGSSVGPGWQRPADAHADALRRAGLRPDVFIVGLVGDPSRRRKAKAWFREANLAKSPPEFVEAHTGFEEVTIMALRTWAAGVESELPVLYAHSKGSYNLSPVTAKHRQIMTDAVVGRWRSAVAALGNHDAAGCFWDGKIFTGNFWWASAGYLAALPVVPCTDRYVVETWVGLGNPVAYEMSDITYPQMAEAILGRAEPDARGIVMPPGTTGLGAAPPPSIPLGWAGRM
jgi:hypothetical protein